MIDVIHGDSREVLRTLDDNSIDAVVTDPPYALVSIGKRFGAEDAAPAKAGKTGAYQRASSGFMGKKWDTGEAAFDPDFWREVLRVLKPGGHVVAFGGTRTFHRLVCAIEDAGFEIREMHAWMFGSGFPKSHDVSKAIDRMNGDARPVLSEGAPVKRMIPGADQNKSGWLKDGTREFRPTVTAAASAAWEGWGTGALNVDACRVGIRERPRTTDPKHSGHAHSSYGAPSGGGNVLPAARWPANVLHDGSDQVLAAFPEAPGALAPTTASAPRATTSDVYGAYASRAPSEPIGDEGSAARFFFEATPDPPWFYHAKADAEDRLGSKHPTVKPVDLMRWLCRLVTPPGGVVLDPFAGSGSTGVAALSEGFDVVLIEREAEYVADIRRRIAWTKGEGRLTAQEKARAGQASDDHGPLFNLTGN